MYAALAAALAGADPAAGAFVRVGHDVRAGGAAERTVALGVERVDGHAVEGEVLPDLALVPDQDGVEFDKALVKAGGWVEFADARY